MSENVVDYGRTKLKAAGFIGASQGEATGVTVAVGTDGLSAGTVQEALQALATRIKALEGGS